MNYFIDKFHIYSPREEFYLLSIQQEDVLTVPLNGDVRRDSEAVLPNGADQYTFECLGCVNGIICLTCKRNDTYLISKSFLALWNPATRDFKTVAYPNKPDLEIFSYFAVLGFGFDVSSNDFKILGVYGVEVEQSSYYEIYSLKTNSWKQIENPRADVSGLPDTLKDGYLNGVYYWMTYILPQEWCPPQQCVIVSFNFTSEVFKVSDLPKDATSLVLESYQVAIALYKERLALVISHKVQEAALYIIRIWAATQFNDSGAPLSWEPVFTMDPIPAISGLEVETILMNGDLQLTFHFPCSHPGECENCYDSEVYQYSHSTGEFKKFELWWNVLFRYVESLYPLSKRLDQV